MKIDRCVCMGLTFDELCELARREHLDLIQLSRRTGCGRQCGWCVAYLRRALQTGRTEFSEMLPREPLE